MYYVAIHAHDYEGNERFFEIPIESNKKDITEAQLAVQEFCDMEDLLIDSWSFSD